MISQADLSYRDLIKEEFTIRHKKNKSYSMRAFARDLGISIGYLSMIFNGKRHLSLSSALDVTKKLQWSLSDQEYFISLLEMENPKTEISKEFATERVQKIKRSHKKYSPIDADIFTSISVWYYGAICTLLTMPGFKATVPAICKKLNVTKPQVVEALERLKRLGFVRLQKGVWVSSQENIKIKSAPSEAVRFYHDQMLTKASVALKQQDFSERDFSNFTLIADVSQIELAKKKIIEFNEEMSQLLEGKKPTELYQLSVQLFKLVETEEK